MLPVSRDRGRDGGVFEKYLFNLNYEIVDPEPGPMRSFPEPFRNSPTPASKR